MSHDRPAPSTYHQQAMVGLALEGGGRFANEVIVTGSTPATQYPPQLPSSPWSNPAGVGLEPPLGVEIDAMEPTGTATEIARSLDQLAALPAPAPIPGSQTSAAIPAEVQARLAELIPKMIRRRKL